MVYRYGRGNNDAQRDAAAKLLHRFRRDQEMTVPEIPDFALSIILGIGLAAATGFRGIVGIVEYQGAKGATDMKRRTRREFLSSAAQAAAIAACSTSLLPMRSARGQTTSKPSGTRPKVALIATVVRKLSHAQHFVDRLLEGYGWQGEHHHPPMDLVSMYVDQFPEADLE